MLLLAAQFTCCYYDELLLHAICYAVVLLPVVVITFELLCWWVCHRLCLLSLLFFAYSYKLPFLHIQICFCSFHFVNIQILFIWNCYSFKFILLYSFFIILCKAVLKKLLTMKNTVLGTCRWLCTLFREPSIRWITMIHFAYHLPVILLYFHLFKNKTCIKRMTRKKRFFSVVILSFKLCFDHLTHDNLTGRLSRPFVTQKAVLY